jgi:hypothetical protein
MTDIVLPQAPLPRRVPVCLRRFRLRWVFDYAGRPPKVGIWDGASELASDGAWAQPKDGLRLARIEAQALDGKEKGEIQTAVCIDGADYAGAEWHAHVRAAALGAPAMNLMPRVHGLSLLSREEKVTVFVDGAVRRRFLTARERLFNATEHRLGAGLGVFR